MSFYDWYADLPNAFPEVWGDQTDVCESADWYNGKYIVVMGSNLNMTRTPDVHFVAEGRHAGAKLVVLSPDFSQVAKYADWWIPIQAGQRCVPLAAVDHVILKEFYVDRQVPYFLDYVKRYSDAPFLVRLVAVRDGRGVHARAIAARQPAGPLSRGRKRRLENARLRSESHEPRMPKGTVGFRWGETKGQWNLKMEDGLDDQPIDPLLSFVDEHDEVLQVEFYEFAARKTYRRGVPVKYVETAEGRVPVVTIFDLLMAHFGVGARVCRATTRRSYDDADAPYTPAWQEQHTGIGRATIIRLAREFAANAETTQGKSMVIIGAGTNHWYHSNLNYRGPITALILCGCCGRNGGGLNHYVGQEKVAALSSWRSLAFALDWATPPRLQQAPLWHYIHTDQWRYEGAFNEYTSNPPDARWAKGHAVDVGARAVRLGWMPFYPQFDRNPIELVRQARAGRRANGG